MKRFVDRPYREALVKYAANRPDVVCLSGDLTQPCEADGFREAYPDRFFNLGMAEQNMMGVAGGMAKGGLLPVVHTFGVFATRRPLDQVEMSIAYPRRRVRLMGFLPGITSPGGVTHQAIDDVAIMSALPNMTVVDLADATEVQAAHDMLDEVDGPSYCRVLRGTVPVLFETPPEFGRARVFAASGRVGLISSSIATGEALRAADALRATGLEIAHAHVSTLKPFTDLAVPELIANCEAGVVTVENHLTRGGLGSSVAEVIAEQGLGARLIRLGIQDTYACGGTVTYLMDRFSMSARHIVEAVETLLGEDVGASLEDVRDSEPVDMPSDSEKPVVEAL